MRVAAGVGPIRTGDELDLSALRRLAVARWRWIVIPTVAAFLVSALVVNAMHSRYTAESRIVLENQRNFLPGPEKSDTSVTQQLDAEAVGSQVQILTSRDLARRVIKTVGLQGNPEFDSLADGMGALDRLLVIVGLKRDPTRLSPEERILESYFDRLTVLSPTKTRVLTVEFSSRDPDLAARVANAIADLYLEFQSDAKREGARAAAQSLGALVADLKTRVAAADAKAEAFRAQSGLLLGANNTSINAQQLADVNGELARARTAQADAQAKAALLRDMLRQGRVGDISEIANNELVRRISEQRVTAKAQLALESRTLLPAHPRIKELSAQVADLEAELRSAGEKAARGLDSDAKVASGRVENLTRALEAQKKAIGAAGPDEVQARELDRAARALKDELDATTTRYQEALARESSRATPSDARVISRALAPQVASFPKKIPIIAFSTIAALLLSTALVAMREFLATPRAPEVERASIPVAAREAAPAALAEEPAPAPEPAAPSRRWRRRARIVAPEAPPAPEPRVAPAALENVAVAAVAGGRPQTLLSLDDVVADIETLGLSAGGLVAAMPLDGEDRGLALALARGLAHRGRVILVAGDAGVLTPGPAGPGLADLLAGAATFGEAIHRDRNARLHIVPAGLADVADRGHVGSVLDALKGTYDAVVLGAPAAMDVEEAQAVMARTEIAVLGPGDPAVAREMTQALREAGVRHVLQVSARAAARSAA